MCSLCEQRKGPFKTCKQFIWAKKHKQRKKAATQKLEGSKPTKTINALQTKIMIAYKYTKHMQKENTVSGKNKLHVKKRCKQAMDNWGAPDH